MPFPEQTPRAFTKENVTALDVGQMGCYGLYRDGGSWIYVGRGDIRERLLAHLSGDNPCIISGNPTHWVDVVTADHVAVEKKLIVEFTPVCNKKIG